MSPPELLAALSGPARVAAIILLAVAGSLLVRGLQRATERILAPARTPATAAREAFAQRYPKFATVTSLVASALTFGVYFGALGLVLREFGVSLTAYLATASVVGLAVAFGSQGLVQDVVIGLTLVFSDAFDIGDMIEISGQIGRVERVGLRFTTLVNFNGQRVYVPNRTIGLVARYRGGVVRAYVDVQIPHGVAPDAVTELVDRIGRGMQRQHRAIFLTEPEIFGVQETEPGGWRYLRVKFRIWPGQHAVIETVLRQRIIGAMKKLDPEFADWMVVVTYRVV